MSKILRPTGDLVAFAKNSLGRERTIFGSDLQSNALSDQFTGAFKRGWGSVASDKRPSIQEFNALGFTLSEMIMYLFQQGIAEYDPNQNYFKDAVVSQGGKLFVSLLDSNKNNLPIDDDGTHWQDASPIPLQALGQSTNSPMSQKAVTDQFTEAAIITATAQSTANQAQSTANQAQIKANNVQIDANEAKQNALIAEQKSSTALLKASDAEVAANSARLRADLGVQKADDAASRAGTAISRADNAQLDAGRASVAASAAQQKANEAASWTGTSGKPETATRWPSWVEVTGKPSGLDPSQLRHTDVGSYALAYNNSGSRGVDDSLVSGSSLRAASAGSFYAAVAGSGTWRAMGFAEASGAVSSRITLFLRIA